MNRPCNPIVAWSLLGALACAAASAHDVSTPALPTAADFGDVDAVCAKPSAECDALSSRIDAYVLATMMYLTENRSPEVYAIARKAADAASPELRVAAAEALGSVVANVEDTPVLVELLDDPVPAVRAAAYQTLGSSSDPRAKLFTARVVGESKWESPEPEDAPDVAKLSIPLYAGAVPLRFATDVQGGTAQLSSVDPQQKVIAFYAAKSKKKPMSLEEFKAAFATPESGDDSADDSAGDSGGSNNGMPSADDMAKAMAMMTKMNQAMNSGKSAEQVGADMGGATVSAEGAADSYADESIYGAPKVVLLEEVEDMSAKKKPVRYVVIYADRTVGRTGIALHAPPVM